MKIKKLLAVIAPLAVMSSSLMISTINAENVTVDVSLSKETVSVEDNSFEVTMSLGDSVAGIQAADFAIEFDSSILNVTSVKAGSIVSEPANDSTASVVPVFDSSIDASGVVNFYYANPSDDSSEWIQDAGTMITISGTLTPTAKAGDVAKLEVKPISRETYAGSGVTNDVVCLGYYTDQYEAIYYDANISNGSVTVVGETQGEDYLKGDANCDGVVTVADVVAAAACASSPTEFALTTQGTINADVHLTGDGISASDASIIQEIALGLI